MKLYVVTVEWSQTDQRNYGVWATSRHEAIEMVSDYYKDAHYYSIRAEVEKIIN